MLDSLMRVMLLRTCVTASWAVCRETVVSSPLIVVSSPLIVVSIPSICCRWKLLILSRADTLSKSVASVFCVPWMVVLRSEVSNLK